VLSIAAIVRSTTNPSVATNRHPIADILFLTPVEMVFGRLSGVRLQGIATRSHASAGLRLHCQSVFKNMHRVVGIRFKSYPGKKTS
jgi:hypothetical protein